MAHRDVKRSDFEGKTVAKIDCRAINIFRFYFTDGTALALEVDAVGLNIYGMVACDVCVAPKKKRKKEATT